jgi:hypothetical protein
MIVMMMTMITVIIILIIYLFKAQCLLHVSPALTFTHCSQNVLICMYVESSWSSKIRFVSSIFVGPALFLCISYDSHAVITSLNITKSL